jgi:hypothetical protein
VLVGGHCGLHMHIDIDRREGKEEDFKVEIMGNI